MLVDADVPAADAAPAVIADSGVATYDAVSLDAFLSDKSVEFDLSIDPFTEGFTGYTATDDIETLFQLIHLTMTAPRVDPLAVDRYLDDQLPFATDPSIDPGYAEFEALLDARYDDPRYLLPTVDSLSTVEADDIERVVRDRFGDASDWSFAFSGDLDVDDMVELAERYLGTLPSSGRVEPASYVEPPPPAGIVDEDTTGGSGSQANVSFLFTAPATIDRRDDVAAMIVQEIVTARLTDVIREQLGESYSPFAMVEVAAGPTPNVETYLSTSTSADLAASVEAGILGELGDLGANGPTEAEFDSAAETVRRQLDLVYNEQVNDEVLNVLVDPEGNPDFADYVEPVRPRRRSRPRHHHHLPGDLDPPRPLHHRDRLAAVVGARGQAPRINSAHVGGGDVALADLDQLPLADLVADHVVDRVLPAAGLARDHVELGAVDDGHEGDRPEALLRARGGPLVLAQEQPRIPHPHVVDADEPAAVARLRLRHQPAGADDDAALHPREHAEAVAAEADLERGGDDGVVIAVVDRPLDLHLAHDLGEVVQLVVAQRAHLPDHLVRVDRGGGRDRHSCIVSDGCDGLWVSYSPVHADQSRNPVGDQSAVECRGRRTRRPRPGRGPRETRGLGHVPLR